MSCRLFNLSYLSSQDRAICSLGCWIFERSCCNIYVCIYIRHTHTHTHTHTHWEHTVPEYCSSRKKRHLQSVPFFSLFDKKISNVVSLALIVRMFQSSYVCAYVCTYVCTYVRTIWNQYQTLFTHISFIKRRVQLFSVPVVVMIF